MYRVSIQLEADEMLDSSKLKHKLDYIYSSITQGQLSNTGLRVTKINNPLNP